MKHVSLIVCFLLVAGFTQAQIKDGNYLLSKNESIITWKVDFSIGTKGHEGTLSLLSGNVMFKGGLIQGGNFVIDMTSVKATDITGQGAKDLEEHLRDKDFLSTAEFPKGFFTVLKSESIKGRKVSVSGYLILKGISNTIILPAGITETNTSIIIKSELTVNRTLWGINYQSGLFGALKDDAISDNMDVTLNLVFKKAQ